MGNFAQPVDNPPQFVEETPGTEIPDGSDRIQSDKADRPRSKFHQAL